MRAKALRLSARIETAAVAFLYFILVEGRRFGDNRRGEMSEFAAPVLMVISGIVWVICIPIYADAIQTTDTSNWTFTGHAGAVTLFQLMPFIFIAGGVIWIIKKALA